MAKILLFGSNSIASVPSNVVDWLYQYTQQGHEFIFGSRKGLDSALHRALSSVGASDKTTIYCMYKPSSNVYDLKCKVFNTLYNEESKEATIVMQGENGEVDPSFEPFVIEGVQQAKDIAITSKWYEFLSRKMMDDCDMAICLWDGESKGEMHCMQILSIKNKPCYTIKF